MLAIANSPAPLRRLPRPAPTSLLRRAPASNPGRLFTATSPCYASSRREAGFRLKSRLMCRWVRRDAPGVTVMSRELSAGRRCRGR